jgi:hypothetical protein
MKHASVSSPSRVGNVPSRALRPAGKQQGNEENHQSARDQRDKRRTAQRNTARVSRGPCET